MGSSSQDRCPACAFFLCLHLRPCQFLCVGVHGQQHAAQRAALATRIRGLPDDLGTMPCKAPCLQVLVVMCLQHAASHADQHHIAPYQAQRSLCIPCSAQNHVSRLAGCLWRRPRRTLCVRWLADHARRNTCGLSGGLRDFCGHRCCHGDALPEDAQPHASGRAGAGGVCERGLLRVQGIWAAVVFRDQRLSSWQCLDSCSCKKVRQGSSRGR